MRKELTEYEAEGLPRLTLVLSDEEKRWDAAMVLWRSARRFQRRAERIARLRGISFAAWQVLEVTERLIRETGDAVSQREVAQRAGVAKSSVSELMRGLELGGFVDGRPDGWGMCVRIWLTKSGERLVVLLRAELVAIALGGSSTKGL